MVEERYEGYSCAANVCADAASPHAVPGSSTLGMDSNQLEYASIALSVH